MEFTGLLFDVKYVFKTSLFLLLVEVITFSHYGLGATLMIRGC